MKRNIVSILVLIFISSMAVFAQDTTSDSSYLIKPGDKIVGNVLGDKEFNFEVVVDDNGKFELPYVGDDKMVMAKCRTKSEVKKEVRKHYSRFLRNPQLHVQVTNRRKPVPITVSGEVKKQLQVELSSSRKPTLFELISLAGGQRESAGGIVRVFRTGIEMCSDEKTVKQWNTDSENGTTLPSRMFRMTNIRAGIKDSNPLIYPGDLVVVEKAAPVYFVGEVMKRDGVYIKEGGLSLTTAIAMVGGVQEKAKIKDIKIYRLKGNNPTDREEISVNLELIKEGKVEDIMLQPYDIIDIDKKTKSMAQKVLEVVTGVGTRALTSFSTSGASRILY